MTLRLLGLVLSALLTVAGGALTVVSLGQRDTLAWAVLLVGLALGLTGGWLCSMWIDTQRRKR